MNLKLSGSLAVVTGASQGLGEAVVRELAEHGARVVLVARRKDRLNAIRDSLPRPTEHHVVAVDLTEEPTAQAKAIVSACGSPQIVVHNLGGSLGVQSPFAELADWDRVWRLNLGVPVAMNSVFVPNMVEQRYGRIVHISSPSAENVSGYPAYSVAKAGLNAYVKSLARSVVPNGVLVNAVSPGPLRAEGRFLTTLANTDPQRLRKFFDEHLDIARLAEPAEIAPLVALLCSPVTSYMSGAILSVDGGSR